MQLLAKPPPRPPDVHPASVYTPYVVQHFTRPGEAAYHGYRRLAGIWNLKCIEGLYKYQDWLPPTYTYAAKLLMLQDVTKGYPAHLRFIVPEDFLAAYYEGKVNG